MKYEITSRREARDAVAKICHDFNLNFRDVENIIPNSITKVISVKIIDVDTQNTFLMTKFFTGGKRGIIAALKGTNIEGDDIKDALSQCVKLPFYVGAWGLSYSGSSSVSVYSFSADIVNVTRKEKSNKRIVISFQ